MLYATVRLSIWLTAVVWLLGGCYPLFLGDNNLVVATAVSCPVHTRPRVDESPGVVQLMPEVDTDQRHSVVLVIRCE